MAASASTPARWKCWRAVDVPSSAAFFCARGFGEQAQHPPVAHGDFQVNFAGASHVLEHAKDALLGFGLADRQAFSVARDGNLRSPRR